MELETTYNSTRLEKQSKDAIVFNRPTLSKKELQSVLECMVHDEISFGNVVRNFEKQAAETFEFQHAMASPSLNAAYHLAFLSLEISEGDEVILPVNSSVAALDAIGYIGAKPVLVDIGRNSLHPEIEDIQKKVTENTKAILLHYAHGAYKNYGNLRASLRGEKIEGSPDTKIKDNSSQYKQIKIIEDISYIAGRETPSGFVGSEADIVILGLNEDMIITMGRGALIMTNSRNIFSFARDLRNHAVGKTYKMRYDYTITDYQAAMGLEQLGHIASILERRKKIGHVYLDVMKQLLNKDRLQHYFQNPDMDAYGSFPVLFDANLEHTAKFFKSLRIDVKRVMLPGPMHHMLGLPENDFANAERLYQKAVLIPLYPNLTKSSVERISSALKTFY